MYDAVRAPRAAASPTMRGISSSVRPGITGAMLTPTGTPCAASVAIASSRRAGADVLGSMILMRSPFRLVIESMTWTSPRRAIAVSMSMSRRTRAFFVMMLTGLRELEEDLETPARERELPLDGLVGVGVAGECDGLGDPSLRREGCGKEPRGVRLDHDRRFKIDPGGEAQVLVGGAGIAVDAAVFASPVRVQAECERDIRAVVPYEDRPGAVLEVACRDRSRRGSPSASVAGSSARSGGKISR